MKAISRSTILKKIQKKSVSANRIRCNFFFFDYRLKSIFAAAKKKKNKKKKRDNSFFSSVRCHLPFHFYLNFFFAPIFAYFQRFRPLHFHIFEIHWLLSLFTVFFSFLIRWFYGNKIPRKVSKILHILKSWINFNFLSVMPALSEKDENCADFQLFVVDSTNFEYPTNDMLKTEK